AAEPDDGPAGREPDELDAAAREARAEEAGLTAQVEGDCDHLAEAVHLRASAEAALVAEERRVAAAERAAADRREGLVRLAGQVAAARTRLETRDAEVGRLTTALHEARERASAAEGDFLALEQRVAGMDEGEVGLGDEHEAAAAAFEAAERRVGELRAEEREAERERAALAARKEALELGLSRKDAPAASVAAG